MERNLNFDEVINRKNTKSLKYDFAKERGMSEDLLPLWVADMDFKTSSYIIDALENQVKHGIFGYSDGKEEYFLAIKKWMEKHKWEVEEKWLVKTPGVVFALAMAVKAYTKQGDSVLIQSPVYYPFGEVIKDNGRNIVESKLVLDEQGYHMDFIDLEKKIMDQKVKLMFLCNPHNPVGRVWKKEELIKIGEICKRQGVIVVSDEIHGDFVFVGEHTVFANINDFKEFTITCTSPSKTFNLAGLQMSNIFISNSKLRKEFKRQIYASGYSQLNVMGLVACETAYTQGEQWYKGMYSYIKENIAYTERFLKENLPQIKMLNHEGTYLVWLDFRDLGLSSVDLEDLIINKAKLWLDSGEIFGDTGVGFQRINVACPRAILTNALERLEKAVKNK